MAYDTVKLIRIYGTGGVWEEFMKHSFGELLLTEDNRKRLEENTVPVTLCHPQIPYTVTMDLNARIHLSGQKVSSS